MGFVVRIREWVLDRTRIGLDFGKFLEFLELRVSISDVVSQGFELNMCWRTVAS